MNPPNETASKILDLAEHFTQTRGFNAFSYRDLQRELGIKTSSIHYYYPAKTDLAVALTERYLARYTQALDDIAETTPGGRRRLERLGDIYLGVVRQNRFCLCGMLASDIVSMPAEVGHLLERFFALNEGWIAEAIALGVAQGDFKASLVPERAAARLLATLEGGMLIARARGRVAELAAVLGDALDNLGA
ncbi:MAG: TetR/AcrR family transcriptional regulator [Candidatus Competibacterales bacterium]